MGAPYSFPEAAVSDETNESDWAEFTISEIDSNSEAESLTEEIEALNDTVSSFADISESSRMLHQYEVNEEMESEQTTTTSSSSSSTAAAESEAEAEAPVQAQAQSPLRPRDNEKPRLLLQQQIREESGDPSDEEAVWGPPPVTATPVVSEDDEEPTIIDSSENNGTVSSSHEDELENFFRELGLGESRTGGGTGNRSVMSGMSESVFTDAATAASIENDSFVPQPSRNFEWMGRSLESLVSGYSHVAPILEPPSSSKKKRRGRRNHRRNSKGNDTTHPPTSPNRRSRRRSLDRCLDPYGSSHHRYPGSDHNRIDGNYLRKRGGPNVALNLLARETTGKRLSPNNRIPVPDRLKLMGGSTLYDAIDDPSVGMCSEVSALEEAMDDGDWIKTQAIISRLSPRLIGDPAAAFLNQQNGNSNSNPSRNNSDPNLPPTAPRFYAGGGRIGLERDAFVLAGGIDVLVRVFREPCFVGAEMARSYDARDLSKQLVTTNRLGHCWNESLACLRELVYSIPTLLDTERIFDTDKDDFLPFLFTLLSHDPFFDGAAALIEEILSLQSHSPQPEDPHEPQNPNSNACENGGCGCDENDTSMSSDNRCGAADEEIRAGTPNGPTVRTAPPTTFFLGNIPDLYTLWGGFNCRQLAHLCRILALLIFEPEDRQLLESPAVLKSIELLQLRRNRAARAGRDSTVDMNQSILLGDERLVKRFLDLLAVMNFAPPLRCSSPFQIMAHFPYIADTLMMLGLHEFENWDDVARYENLARKCLSSSSENGERNELHDLGSVAGMLENLSDAFMNNEGEPTNQLGHIITVIGAAQQAGVVIGRARQRGGSRVASRESEEDIPPRTDTTLNGFATAVGALTDQVIVRRADSSEGSSIGTARSRIMTPGDAANIMQFNSLLLAPYQVEVLFVLCTLLGGRRKIDAQELLKQSGIARILDDMFQRLPWDSLSPTRNPVSNRQNASGNQSHNEDQPGLNGIGCECTPESALCVQYLRLLHNFCDRDCDNYNGRRLLLSSAERKFIFEDYHIGSTSSDISNLSPGLLSKVVAAFVGESDESPYRFWLASCVESYLRGSSSVEQVFVAKTGLVEHLIDDITSQRLHCAGSLQTSFDLLGELCKGNIEVLRLLVGYLDNEEKFRKLMSVAASNLVDSNVFIRSLLLSVERMSYGNHFHDVGSTDGFNTSSQEWRFVNDACSRSFLTHSWWETHMPNQNDMSGEYHAMDHNVTTGAEIRRDQTRASDWFPSIKNSIPLFNPLSIDESGVEDFRDSFGRFGWVYKPETSLAGHPASHGGPDTIDRLSWFLTANRTRLLRDLLEVVNLNNINHENICCLNTAVVITIFANRRHELHELLRDLKLMDEDEQSARLHHSKLLSSNEGRSKNDAQLQTNHSNILKNFREVLWFWVEYYTHRGRDRLSLEFSSRLRFHEWMEVVTLLAADDGAPTALVRRPLSLPQSPYQRIV